MDEKMAFIALLVSFIRLFQLIAFCNKLNMVLAGEVVFCNSDNLDFAIREANHEKIRNLSI